MNTEELIVTAARKKFTDFDIKTKQILDQKVSEKLNNSGYFKRLDIAQNITEKDDWNKQLWDVVDGFAGKWKKGGPGYLKKHAAETLTFYATGDDAEDRCNDASTRLEQSLDKTIDNSGSKDADFDIEGPDTKDDLTYFTVSIPGA